MRFRKRKKHRKRKICENEERIHPPDRETELEEKRRRGRRKAQINRPSGSKNIKTPHQDKEGGRGRKGEESLRKGESTTDREEASSEQGEMRAN